MWTIASPDFYGHMCKDFTMVYLFIGQVQLHWKTPYLLQPLYTHLKVPFQRSFTNYLGDGGRRGEGATSLLVLTGVSSPLTSPLPPGRYLGPESGVPSVLTCGRTNKVKTLPSLVLRVQAVIRNNLIESIYSTVPAPMVRYEGTTTLAADGLCLSCKCVNLFTYDEKWLPFFLFSPSPSAAACYIKYGKLKISAIIF